MPNLTEHQKEFVTREGCATPQIKAVEMSAVRKDHAFCTRKPREESDPKTNDLRTTEKLIREDT